LAFDTSNQLFTFTKPKTNTNMPVAYYNVFLNGGFDLSFSYALIGNVVPTLTNTYGNMYSDNILLNGIYNVSSSTTSINGNGNIYQSFNSSGSNYWYVSNTGLNTTLVGTTTVSGEWLQIKLPCRLNMTSFQTVGVSNSPSSFILAGSNTGTTWDKLLNYNVINVVGGTSYSIGSTTYVKFTGSGTIRSAIPLQANIILVAGGGSGGGGIFGAPGGGGGAGGVAYGNIDLQSNIIYNINIGVGGSGYLINNLGSTGGNTYINELSANYFVYGGGGGGSANAYYGLGGDGGCGGGAIAGINSSFGAVGGGVLLKGPYNKLSYLSNVGGYYGGGGAGGLGSNISTGGGGPGYKWIDGNTVSIGGNTGSTSVNTNGANSTVYGGGGGGGSSNSNNPGGNGGNGSPGLAIFAFNTSSIIQSISGFINQPIVTSNSYAYYRIICTAPLTGNVALSQINFTGVPDSFSLPNVNGNTYNVNANYGPNRESSKSNSVTAVLTVPTISTSTYADIANGYIRFQIYSVPPTGALPYNINNVMITPMPSPPPLYYLYLSNAIVLYNGGFLGDTSYNFSLNASYDSAGNSAFSPIITSRYTLTVPTISTITSSRIGGNTVFSINSVLPTGASNYTLTNVNISPAPSPTPLFDYSSNIITLNSGFQSDTSYNFRLNASYGFGGNSAFSPIITSRYTLTVPTISSITSSRIDGNIVFSFTSALPTGASNYTLTNVNISPAPSPTPLFSYSSNIITLNSGFQSDTSYNFSLNASYGSFGNSAYSNILTGRYTIPMVSSTLQLWLDAKDSSTLVLSGTSLTQWNDKSGNSRNATKWGTSSTNATYLSTGFNGLPTIYVQPGQGFSCPMPSGTTNNGMTAFVVYKALDPVATYSPLITRGTGNSAGPIDMYGVTRLVGSSSGYTNWGNASPFNIGTTLLTLFAFTVNISSYNEYINGTTRYTFTTSLYGDTTNYIYVGTREDKYNNLNGVISEVLVYNSVLSTTDRQNLEGYLALKWKIQNLLPANHPYYAN